MNVRGKILSWTAVTAIAVLATGCGGDSSSPKATASPPPPAPVGISTATKLLAQYTSASNAVTAKDLGKLADIEISPAADASRSDLSVAKAQKIPVAPKSYVTPRFVFPRVTSYPHYFLAIAPLLQSDHVSPAPAYMVFVQDQANAPWKVAYYPLATDTSGAGLPTLDTDAVNGVPPVTDDKGLLVSPDVLAGAYNDDAEGHKDANVPLAPSQALSVDLVGTFNADSQELKSRGGVLTRTVLSKDYPTYMVRTKDGGALAFTAVKVQDRMTTSSGTGTVSLDPGSPEAAMAGNEQGTKAPSYTIDRLETYLSVIPPASTPGAGVQLLGFSDYLLSVD